MKVTLITATYNSEANLQSCLESVAQQRYKNIEHLIIDGASTDGTLDIVKKQAQKHPNLRYHSEADKGIYDALNKGVQRASGAIIGLVHSDDVLANPDTVGHVVDSFKAHGVDGVYGDLKYVSAENLDHTIRYWKSTSFHPKKLRQGWMPPHPTLFLKKEVYERYGSFNTKLKIAADYDFILRIFSDASLQWAYLPELISIMRVGGESNKSFANILLKSREDYQALQSNQIRHPLAVLLQKNLRKIPQWLR